MMTRMASSSVYRRLLLVLGLVFLAGRLVIFFVFPPDRLPEWSLSLLFSPFLAPALTGAFVMQVMARPLWREIVITAGIGALFGVLHFIAGKALGLPQPQPVIDATFGLGAASLSVMGVQSAWGTERAEWLSLLLPAAVLPAFVAVSDFFLGMTAVLHPTVYDASVFLGDDFFGAQPSFVAGRIFARVTPLGRLCTFVYWGLPAALAFVYAARRREDEREAGDVLFSFVTIGVVGLSLYHVYPVVGPIHFFPRHFPTEVPVVRNAIAGDVLRRVVPRNCMPSLHTSWALLLHWHARRLGRAARVSTFAWLLLTMIATLGFGFHYAMDLVVAFPFTLSIRAAFALKHDPESGRARHALWFGASSTAAWFVVLRLVIPENSGGSALRWGLAIATVVVSWILERALDARGDTARSPAPPVSPTGGHAEEAHALAPSALRIGVPAVFFVSGISGLIYEIVFAKQLALTFGSTAAASTTVLATYMGGISLGAFIGGELGERRSDPLRVYALCEVGVALYCAATPWMFGALRPVYVSIASGIDPGRPILVLLQAVLGAAVVLPPTTLAGITMPVLAKQFAARGGLGRSIGLLYAANTLGAALGSWLTGYVVLSFLGVTRTTWLAVFANLVVGFAALRLSAKLGPAGALATGETPIAAGTPEVTRSAGIVAIAVLAVGGFVTLALETTDIHLLAIVAGNSAYAFALMLFAFLVGLGGGASFARRLLRRTPARLFHLCVAELGLAAAVLAGVHGWDRTSGYFASFATYPIVRTFAARELVRFVVCCSMMIPPAFVIGMIYPLAMDLVTRGAGDNPVRATGRAAALNTVGNIAGAVVGGFLLVPRAGSLHALECLAGASIALALTAFFWLDRRERRRVLMPALGLAVLCMLEPRSFDYDELAGGANVYFVANPHGHVIAHAESLDGGLTTVHESTGDEGARVLTLLTNGKFQGDDGREMKAQLGFSLYPLLHTAQRRRALVIGLGTGVTTATVHRAGFREIDVAELSADVARITDAYFGSINDKVLREPNVKLHVTDGRNFLLLGKKRYDLITIELTSIWFAGAASLYNREFYQIVKARLEPDGVLQQWVQLHHVDPGDIASILATLHSEFSRVWLYFGGGQGILVACQNDCAPNRGTLAAIEETPALADSLALTGGGAAHLLADRLLSPDAVDRFLSRLESQGLDVSALLSTDDNLFLEYDTPRGNVRGFESSLVANVALLREFSPASPAEGTKLSDAEIAAMTGDAR